jgi:mannose-6-phosphate isomerase-like protein (cupin superfamily)
MTWRRLLTVLVGGASLAIGTRHLHAQGALPPARANAGKILSADQGEEIGGGMLLKVGPVNTGSKHLFTGFVNMPPGGDVPIHRRGHEEALFVHQGHVALTLGERRADLAPGTTVYVPPGTWWGLVNTGSEPATVMFMFGQAEVERCFRKGILHLSPQDSARVERSCPFEFR